MGRDENKALADKDRDNLRKYLDGYENGFFEFYQRHVNGLYNFIYKYVRVEQLAEEIVQESFMKFLEKIEKLNFKYAPSTFLYNIASNLCLDVIKSKYHSSTVLVGDDSINYFKDKDNDKYYLLKKKEIVNKINECVDSLNPKVRLVYMLRKETDLTFNEISITTGIPLRTVNRYLKKALHKIVEHLKKYGFSVEDLL